MPDGGSLTPVSTVNRGGFDPVSRRVIVYDRWTTEYSKLWAKRLTEIKYRVESKGKGDG